MTTEGEKNIFEETVFHVIADDMYELSRDILCCKEVFDNVVFEGIGGIRFRFVTESWLVMLVIPMPMSTIQG